MAPSLTSVAHPTRALRPAFAFALAALCNLPGAAARTGGWWGAPPATGKVGFKVRANPQGRAMDWVVRDGHDLQESRDVCRQACEQDPACFEHTYDYIGMFNQHGKHCIHYNYLAVNLGRRPSAEACRNECQRNAKCQAWSFRFQRAGPFHGDYADGEMYWRFESPYQTCLLGTKLNEKFEPGMGRLYWVGGTKETKEEGRGEVVQEKSVAGEAGERLDRTSSNAFLA